MILLIHIVAALSSLILAALAFLYPSKAKINATYVTTTVMLITGFSLILSKPAHITQTCIEGLAYLALVFFGIVGARHKLALKKSE